MSVRLSGDYGRKPATPLRWVLAALGRARPASEGHSYRDAIDALGRIQRRYLR
jgi:hypothetical protein